MPHTKTNFRLLKVKWKEKQFFLSQKKMRSILLISGLEGMKAME